MGVRNSRRGLKSPISTLESSRTGGDARRPSAETLASQQRPGQTRRSPAAVDAQLGARESADVESGSPQLGIGLCVLFQGEQTPVAQREHVTGESVALRIVDF